MGTRDVGTGTHSELRGVEDEGLVLHLGTARHHHRPDGLVDVGCIGRKELLHESREAQTRRRGEGERGCII
jgi:hypothetical protein